jgi:hypothetical protein
MIAVKFAQGTELVHLPGGETVRVIKGTHWPATDPIVRARPELFTDDPRFGMLYTVEPDGYDAPIEQATAGPGERRNARRAS